jgi:hypothetical protein
VYLRAVEVSPPGGTPFAVGVAGLPVRADIPARHAPSAVVVHVISPIAFDGAVPAEEMPFVVAHAAEIADRRLRVVPGMRVRAPVATGGGVIADLVLGPGLVAREVPIGADLLTLDFVARPAATASVASGWIPSGPSLRLHALDGAAAPVTVEVTGLAVMLEQRGTERDGLLPVAASWSDGAALAGRVSLREIRQTKPGETFAAPPIDPGLPAGIDPCGLSSTAPGVWRGPRRVSAGTIVYAEPGRSAWGRLPEAVDLDVELAPGAFYAAIVVLPGLVPLGDACGEPRAWVEAAALAGPAPAR